MFMNCLKYNGKILVGYATTINIFVKDFFNGGNCDHRT